MFHRRLLGAAAPAAYGVFIVHREEMGTPLTEEWAYLKALSHAVDSGLQRRPTGYYIKQGTHREYAEALGQPLKDGWESVEVWIVAFRGEFVHFRGDTYVYMAMALTLFGEPVSHGLYKEGSQVPFRVKPLKPSFLDRINRQSAQESLTDDAPSRRPRTKSMAPTSGQLSHARHHWIRGTHEWIRGIRELAPFVQDYADEEMSTLRELLAELQTVPTSEELAARYNSWESVPRAELAAYGLRDIELKDQEPTDLTYYDPAYWRLQWEKSGEREGEDKQVADDAREPP